MAKAKQENTHVSDVRPEFVMLGFLMYRSMHGYDLFTLFQRQLGRVWHISQSQMYAILKRLESQGLVEGLVQEQEGSPARRYLAITDDGRAHFGAWLLAPTDCSSRVLRLEFISRLFFASIQGPDLLAALVAGQEAQVRRQLANHEALLATLEGDDLFNRLGLEFRIEQLKAELSWLASSVAPVFLPPGD